MNYTAKNLLWCAIVLLYCICALLLSGCASEGQWISIRSIAHSAKYQRDCVGPNAPFTPWDRECMMPQEPNVQMGQVQRVDTRSTWREREDIMMWCRMNPMQASSDWRCQGLEEVSPDRSRLVDWLWITKPDRVWCKGWMTGVAEMQLWTSCG